MSKAPIMTAPRASAIVAKKAQKYREEQAALSKTVTAAQAVDHIISQGNVNA